MELTLLRHGIPVDPTLWDGPESMRPLTAEGRTQAQAVIGSLAKSGNLSIEEIWSSPYVRCVETARIAAEILGIPMRLSPALASGADLIRSLPHLQGDAAGWPGHLLCVGHAPDLGLLISALTRTSNGHYSLGRCGVARLTGKFALNEMKLEWIKNVI